MNKGSTADREMFWGVVSLVMTLLIAWQYSSAGESPGADIATAIFILPFLYLFVAIAFALSLKFFITNISNKAKIPEAVRKQKLIYTSIGIFAPLIMLGFVLPSIFAY